MGGVAVAFFGINRNLTLVGAELELLGDVPAVGDSDLEEEVDDEGGDVEAASFGIKRNLTFPPAAVAVFGDDFCGDSDLGVVEVEVEVEVENKEGEVLPSEVEVVRLLPLLDPEVEVVRLLPLLDRRSNPTTLAPRGPRAQKAAVVVGLRLS